MVLEGSRAWTQPSWKEDSVPHHGRPILNLALEQEGGAGRLTGWGPWGSQGSPEGSVASSRQRGAFLILDEPKATHQALPLSPSEHNPGKEHAARWPVQAGDLAQRPGNRLGCASRLHSAASGLEEELQPAPPPPPLVLSRGSTWVTLTPAATAD